LIEHLRKRAKTKGDNVLQKLEELVREGESRGALSAEGLKAELAIEWEGDHIVVPVEVRKLETWEDEDKIRIKVKAVVDGVEGEWVMTFFRYGRTNAVIGCTNTRDDAPGGRTEDAKRIIALVKTLTGEEQNIKRDKYGKIKTNYIHETAPRSRDKICRNCRDHKEVVKQQRQVNKEN
jgi:hypothetical protein